MSKAAELKEKSPELYTDEQIRSYAENADNLHEIKVLKDTKGGEVMLKMLMGDVAAKTRKFATSYNQLTYNEMVALGADINAYLAVARLFMNADANLKEYTTAVDEALEKALRN